MRCNKPANRQEAVLLLQLFAIAVYLTIATAHVCEVGREKDKNDKWMWVLPYDKPCLCTQIVMGGMNTWTPIRPFKPTYVKSPLLSDNMTMIRAHYKLRCEEEGVTQSMTMSASLKAALSSTEFGISSEEIISQTAAKLSTFVSLFSTTASEPGIEQEIISQTAAKLSTFVSLFSTTASEPGIEQATTANNATGKASTSAVAAGTTKAGQEEISHNLALTARSSAAIPEAATTTTAVQGATTSTAKQKAATTVQECESIPLGMASGAIPDSNITASSFQHVTSRDWDREPKYARLGSDKFWSAVSAIDSAPWIRVFLGSSFLVTELQTERVRGKSTQYWVKTITVKVGTSVNSLKFIEDEAVPKVFYASYTGRNDMAYVTLDPNGILTKFVEIHPTNCWQKRGQEEISPYCVLRFEILGCSKL